MAESYGNILSLPNDQFMSMLPELQAQGVDTDELRRSYRRANSIFSPLYDWMGGSEANVAEQGRSPVGFGLLSKPEGTTGMDAVRGLQLEPQQFMSGLLGAVAQGADAPYAAVQGQMPTQDMMGEAMNTAGLAMGSGGVVADIPAGAVGANMLRGGKMSDPTYTGWTFKDVDGNIPLSKAENKMLSEGAKAPTQEVVPIRSMYAMQDRVNPDFATTETSAGNLPNAVRKDGKIYLQDGHHRVTKVSEEGDQNVRVNLYDFDNVDKSTPLLDYSPEKAARDKAEMDSIMAELFPDDPLYANASKTGGAFASLFNQEAQAFNKAALDPAGLSGVKMPDFVQNIDYKATPTGLLAPQVNIDIADMKGKTLIPAYGDRTYGGANLTEIGGVKLDQPVEMQGGHDFMRDQETGLWASEKSPMNTKARFIDDLIAEGEDPTLVYTAMGGQSGDFSHHMGDTVMGMVEQSKITKAAAKEYDKTIRDTVDPKWVGILSPKAREYLDTKMTGSNRRLLWQEMDKTKWSDQGFPHVGVARTAITDPELLTVAPFSSGLSIGQPSGGGLLSLGNNRPHKSYSSQIGGDYMGKLENQVSGDVMWRDFFGDRRAAGVKPSGDQRSFMMSPYIKQKVDDQMIDEVSTIMERLRKVGK